MTPASIPVAPLAADARSSDPGSLYFGYACPQSGQPLVLRENRLETADGAQRYAVDRGLPDFRSRGAKESASEGALLDRLVASAALDGWEQALRSVDPESVGYVTGGDRAAYLDLLPIGPDSRVLEIGASKGQHTTLIAPRCRGVYALEIVPGQARFTQIRCAQSELDHVHVAIGGDDGRLPYLDNLFDVVVMNLVLEWCAARDRQEAFADVQQRVLAECCRVTASGGCFFISTKNRYASRLLLGGIDEHVGFRYGNALPRPLMQARLKSKGKDRPDGLLHSFGELRKMLHRAGFSKVEPYWAIPDARFPKAYVPFDDRDAMARALENPDLMRHNSRSVSALLRVLPARLIPWIAPSLVFVAHKSA